MRRADLICQSHAWSIEGNAKIASYRSAFVLHVVIRTASGGVFIRIFETKQMIPLPTALVPDGSRWKFCPHLGDHTGVVSALSSDRNRAAPHHIPQGLGAWQSYLGITHDAVERSSAPTSLQEQLSRKALATPGK